MLDLSKINSRLDKARALVHALCHGDHKWRMCIPLQPDDTDVVFGNTIQDAKAMIDEIERLRKDSGALTTALEFMLVAEASTGLTGEQTLEANKSIAELALREFGNSSLVPPKDKE